MKKNVGKADKVIRLLIAITITLLYFFHFISGTTAALLLTVAAIFVATSLINFCPIYWTLGISSHKNEK